MTKDRGGYFVASGAVPPVLNDGWRNGAPGEAPVKGGADSGYVPGRDAALGRDPKPVRRGKSADFDGVAEL